MVVRNEERCKRKKYIKMSIEFVVSRFNIFVIILVNNKMSQNYSQLGQDLDVLKYYNNMKNGYFVEIGASDGICLSNTYLLETQYNWKGICVEPIPEKFTLLQTNRKNAHCCHNPVYDQSNIEVVFDIADHADLLSGISKHIDRWKDVVDGNKRQIILTTIGINDLLEKYNTPHFINYLSLDTEGSEFEILRALNFQKYSFGLIDVEHNYIEPKRTHIRELLTSNGYSYYRQNDFDDSYIYNPIIIKSEVYYYLEDYSKPIIINYMKNYIQVMSPYWPDDFGVVLIECNVLAFYNLGNGKIYDDFIEFGKDNIWHKDKRKNLLFIGANDMAEIEDFVDKYNNGLFIEAIPYTFERLQKNLIKCKKYNTNYIPLNNLVTSEADKEYTFNIFNNDEGSSSIYEPNQNEWQWSDVKIKEQIKLNSSTIVNILKEQNWENKKYDVVLDVQGAELEVLKGFGPNLLNIISIRVEISTREFYKGGVLFEELNSFFISNSFKLNNNPTSTHCDVIYSRI